jgi:hypothetical protein
LYKRQWVTGGDGFSESVCLSGGFVCKQQGQP